MIFGKALFRPPDRADDALFQISFATDPIVQLFFNGIEEKPVNREIPPHGISLRISEGDYLRTAAIAVIGFGAESGNLKLVAALEHEHDSEFAADCDSFRKKLFDLLGPRRSGDVIVL